jgi:hypothetical protein
MYFNSEDEGRKFLQNIDIHLQEYTMSQPRIQKSENLKTYIINQGMYVLKHITQKTATHVTVIHASVLAKKAPFMIRIILYFSIILCVNNLLLVLSPQFVYKLYILYRGYLYRYTQRRRNNGS